MHSSVATLVLDFSGSAVQICQTAFAKSSERVTYTNFSNWISLALLATPEDCGQRTEASVGTVPGFLVRSNPGATPVQPRCKPGHDLGWTGLGPVSELVCLNRRSAESHMKSLGGKPSNVVQHFHIGISPCVLSE
jgi:hypothetical protein